MSGHRYPSNRQYFLLIFPPVLIVLSFLLSSQQLNIDDLINDKSNPFADEFGRLLRHPRWNIMPMMAALAIMVALSTSMAISRLRNRTYAYVALAAFLVITSSISAWPMFSGDLNGYWQPARPPEDYLKVNSLLESEGGAHHAVWFPSYYDRAIWSNSDGPNAHAAPTGLFATRSSALPSFKTSNYYFFDYYNPVRGVFTFNPLPVYGGNLSAIYEPLDIKYFTISHDGAWFPGRSALGFTNKYLKGIAADVPTTSSVRELYSGEYITTFELQNNVQQAYTSKPILALDRLTTFAQLTPFIDKDSSMIFGTSLDNLNKGIEVSDYVVLNDPEDLLLLSNGGTIIKPSDFTNVVARTDWSEGSVHNLQFARFLTRNAIDWSWQFDYGAGLVYTSASDAKLEFTSTVPEQGDYRVLVRYLSSTDGGSFEATVGSGRAVTVNTDRNLGSAFEWADLGERKLEAGSNDIVIKNKNGANAVNLIVLVPSIPQDIKYDNLSADLSSKNLIYFFEAENDFERIGGAGTTAVRNGINFSASDVGLGLDILKDDNYRLALKGRGDFSVSISNDNTHASLDLESEALGHAYSSPVALSKGTYQLQISGNPGSYLDYVVLYPQDDDDDGINSMFNSDDSGGNQVVTYEKIDPTLHQVHVKASEPFMLTFAEGYDKFWTAEVKTADGIKRYEPVELYGVINGFWIDEVGEYDISIKYQPQDWFYEGTVVSLLTLVAIVLYLVYPKIYSKARSYLISRTKLLRSPT